MGLHCLQVIITARSSLAQRSITSLVYGYPWPYFRPLSDSKSIRMTKSLFSLYDAYICNVAVQDVVRRSYVNKSGADTHFFMEFGVQCQCIDIIAK